MLLERVRLIGFGKFDNKEIEFKEGINLIYGENEAGKSTIHSFIDGIFYGFLRPGARRVHYLDEHEKYNPWNTSRYAGLIDFNYEGRKYTIEREFTKGKEATRVIDGGTGGDLTKELDLGSNRILQPGLHFFGFSSRIFSNTISIGQLGSRTEERLANELREKIVNVNKSLDDRISVDGAVEELRSLMAEIGTDRAPTRPYAQNLKKLQTLERERREILEDRGQYNDYLLERDRLEEDLILASKELAEKRLEADKLEFLKRVRKFQEAEILTEEIDRLKQKLDRLRAYDHLSMEDYRDAIGLESSLQHLSDSLLEKEEEKKRLDQVLRAEENKGQDQGDEKNYQGLEKDYRAYEDLEEKRNQLAFSKKDSSLEFIKRDYQALSLEVEGIGKKRMGLGLLTGLSAIIAGLYFIRNKFTPGLVFPVLFILGFLPLNKKKKGLEASIKDLEGQMETIKEEEGQRLEEIREIEGQQGDLLSKYRLASRYELKEELERLRHSYLTRGEDERKLEENKERMSQVLAKLERLKKEREDKADYYQELMDRNRVQDLEAFKEGLDRKGQLDKNRDLVKSKEEALDRLLDQDSLEGLRVEVDGSDLLLDEGVLGLDPHQVKYEIQRLDTRIVDNRIALKGVEENIRILEKNIGRLVEIEEEIGRKKSVEEELSLKYEALQLAASTIEEISKEIQNEFAPQINRQMGKIISDISNGAYSNIRLTESLDINIENPETGELVHINSLSGGTIDQIYFGLRFGIISSMADKKFPLILDDCFVQYDGTRLENILDFLRKTSLDRQILLFTCHKREKEILDGWGQEYNLIELT